MRLKLIMGFLMLASISLNCLSQDSTKPAKALSKEQGKYIEQVKSELAFKVRHAIDNIKDDSLKLGKLYGFLWDDNDRIIADLNAFYNYLTGQSDSKYVYKYVPDPAELDAALIDDLYADVPSPDGKLYATTTKYRKDLLANFLLDYLMKTKKAGNIDNISMDIEYRKGWRDLETIYANAVIVCSQLKAALSECTPTDCSIHEQQAYKTLLGQIKDVSEKKSYMLKILNNSFFKSWLWYNDGYLLMSPLASTTKDRRYPFTEKNSQLTDDMKKLLQSDSLEDLALKKALTIKQAYNETLKPNAKNKNENREYDAEKGYQCVDADKLEALKYNDKNVAIIVHNVSKGETLSLSQTSTILVDRSTASIEISDVTSFGTLKDILDGIGAWVTASDKVLKGINNFQALPNKGVLNYTAPSVGESGEKAITVNKVVSKSEKEMFRANKQQTLKLSKQNYLMYHIDGLIDSKPTYRDSINLLNFDAALEDKTVTDKEFNVKINYREIPATKNALTDKTNFIVASLVEPGTEMCNSCKRKIPQCLIDTFLQRDWCYTFDYIEKKQLEEQVCQFLKRFECYIETIRKCRESLDKDYKLFAETYIPTLKNVLCIVQRSLPMLDKDMSLVKRLKNEQPEKRTVILNVALSEAPKTITYSVTSSLTAKRVEGKDPGSTNVVIVDSFKYVKKHFIDFSVGLSYLFGDYSITAPDPLNNNLPKVADGDRFKPTLGLHYYPCGLIKVDNKVFSKMEHRFSFYAGLSFKNALDNLYLGASWDIVPGIRIIAGNHFYKNTKYLINNNIVVDQASSFKSSGFFMSVNLEPKAFASIIGLIK